MVRVAIFISGGGSNMVSLLEAMKDPAFGAEPVLVLSNTADATGLEKAASQGVATEVVDHRNYSDRTGFEKEMSRVLVKYAPDVVCLAGFMRILTGDFTGHWEGRMLNIHPSLLPKYKGLKTHQRALEAQDSKAGCTVHLVTATLDDGPVLAQAEVSVLDNETPESLAARVLSEEHKLYPAALREFVRSL